MCKPQSLLAGLLSLAFVGVGLPAASQIELLRNGDDQYIQGLREQGMSDLLERFKEVDPPEDPVARLALDVSLNDFIAEDLLARAADASAVQDYAAANELFRESRVKYEGMLEAQRQLIKTNPDDERMPIWQTDFAQMLLGIYLPRYHDSAAWHYEFGSPNAEQVRAYESAMVEALEMTADASHRLDLLTNRVAADGALRGRLEEMQIWFKLQDYQRINTPYWFAHGAHGVSLLPDGDAYFKAGDRVRGQKADAGKEKERLRDKVVAACGGALLRDERTKLTARLLSGQTLVHSSDMDFVDEGVDEYLEPVIRDGAGTYHGYLATLAKAVGRWNVDEKKTATQILLGMGSNEYVRNDPTVVSRLLAADLLFRLLTEDAEKAPADQRGAKIAAAYETAYIPLVDGDDDRFRQVLFTRWAESVGEEVDPASLPATVRMGIGEQLTNRGGGLAQALVALSMEPAPAIPAEAQQRREAIRAQAEAAEAVLERAVVFNETLTGESMPAGAVLGRGLYNLGTCQYWLAEVGKALNGGQSGWRPYYKVCETWLELAVRVPEDGRTKEALGYSVGLLLGMDNAVNKGGVRELDLRTLYRQAFELIDELDPTSQAAQDNRLYAGFFLYEQVGDLEKAAEVYGALPSSHRDYFEVRRQMIYVMQRVYRKESDRLRLMDAIKPSDNPPSGLTAQEVEAYKEKARQWGVEYEALDKSITGRRGLIIEEAELVMIDAEDAVENNEDPKQRFEAATAIGACRVVLAGMESDQGDTDKAMEMLEGFEERYSPGGKYKDLAALQADPEAAAGTLNGLVRSAQEQRILALLDAKRTEEMAEQAKVMMDQSPDVAAAVIDGVQKRIGAEIDREKRVVEEAAFEVIREKAGEEIKFYADAAVSLGQLLVQWAEQQGFDEKKMATYQMPLADSLMLAGEGQHAVDIMEPIVELYPNNFRILIRAGHAHLSVYREGKDRKNFNAAMKHFSKVAAYYNHQSAKAPPFWEAWLGIFELVDAEGDSKQIIPARARMLYGFDENLGGASYKEGFEVIIRKHGGPERLLPQPGAAPAE